MMLGPDHGNNKFGDPLRPQNILQVEFLQVLEGLMHASSCLGRHVLEYNVEEVSEIVSFIQGAAEAMHTLTRIEIEKRIEVTHVALTCDSF